MAWILKTYKRMAIVYIYIQLRTNRIQPLLHLNSAKLYGCNSILPAMSTCPEGLSSSGALDDSPGFVQLEVVHWHGPTCAKTSQILSKLGQMHWLGLVL